jgi:hypothetical protein
MKKSWRLLMVLWVALGVVLGPGALSAWTRPDPPFHGHGRDRDDHGRDRDDHDHGRGNHGRHRGWDRDREGRYRFNNYDRRAVDAYYWRHRDDRWFRERGPRGLALGYGYVVGPRYRRYCHPLPVVMVRDLPPPPPGLRYFFFGGNVIMVDNGYRVHDFIHINIDIGR